ncbi:MAG: hypothetical protein Q7R88_03175, partial [bacterium]|nr:hypothetical protein [bacterium]
MLVVLALPASAAPPPVQTTLGDEGDSVDLSFMVKDTLLRGPNGHGRPIKAATAAPIFRIGIWVAPSPDSPYWNGARDNAMVGIRENRAVGTGPTAYIPLTPGAIGTAGMISLTTPPLRSWMGVPNPLSPNELGYGNRVHFSLYISSGVVFRLNDVTAFQIRSSDTNNALRFEGNLTANTYSPTRVGIWWGFDGVQGTADDVIRTAGPGTGLINELVFIGVANAFVANSPQVLDQIVQYIEQSQPFTVTGEYAVRIGDTTHRPSRTLPFFSTGAQDIRLGISRQSNFRLITLTG